jgi:hypothetical protein
MALSCGDAGAVPYTTGSVSIIAATSTHTNILTTTAFDLTLLTVGTSQTGSLVGAAGLPFLAPPTTIDFAIPSTFGFDVAGIGEFDPSIVTLLSETTGTFQSQTYAVVGTFIIGSLFSNSGQTISGNETWTLNQTKGDGNAVSIGGTFQAPAKGIPEPMSLLLLGSGLLVAGRMSRRRKSQPEA